MHKCSSWALFFGRTRSSSLFSPLSSSADRVDVQLQSYHRSYSHQQMFAQQQGIYSCLVSSRRPPHRTNRYSCIDSVNVTDRWAPLVVCQGCVYGEPKEIQPASSGAFEAASYFTNTAAPQSAGESSMCCSHNVLRMAQSAWNSLTKSQFLSSFTGLSDSALSCTVTFKFCATLCHPNLTLSPTPLASTPPPHWENRLFFQAQTTCWMDSEPLNVMNATCLHDWFTDWAASILETLASAHN